MNENISIIAVIVLVMLAQIQLVFYYRSNKDEKDPYEDEEPPLGT